MRILTVVPISRGISKDTLTYFTPKDIAIGSIVSIPLRSKTVYGLVLESRDASDLKSELKSLVYSIKKIENMESRAFLSDEFIEACRKTADYNAASVGAVLSSLIPKTILEESGELTFEPRKKSEKNFHETKLLQSDDEERYATYRSLIREEFAKGKSVFFCLPTTEDLANAKGVLEKGIENYTHVLHGNLSKTTQVDLWKKIIEEKHPVLIIATGSFLSIPRGDLGTLVLENESSRGFKMQTRPFIDFRTFAETLAKELGIKLVLGDKLLRIETIWEEKNGKYSELSPLKFRSLVTAEGEIVDVRGAENMKKKEFTILDDKLKSLLKKSIENNERTFLFCGRKGLYPTTLCSDCGTIVVCNNCNSPVVLYGKKEILQSKEKAAGRGNLFVCHHCGERRETEELCRHCGGWRLHTFGIGIERVAEEVRNLFPDTQVFVMDKDNVTTHKQAVKLRDAFYAAPGIMLGTEMALTYLNQKIENTAVVSLDSYFSIPDYQINEKVFHILLTLRNISEKRFLIQTRQDAKSAGYKIFDYAVRGNLIDFYRDEIADRKATGYPPFTTYIKVSLEGDKSAVKKAMEETREMLLPFVMDVFDAWKPGNAARYSQHGLISLPKGTWVDKILLEKLRALPPLYSVRIDPVTLL